jgi:hypothetical protein
VFADVAKGRVVVGCAVIVIATPPP